MAKQQKKPFGIFVAAPIVNTDGIPLLDVVRSAADILATNIGRPVVVRTGGDGAAGTSVMEHLRRRLKDADLLIGDLSGRNPNVMWELGFAQALRKPLLVVARDSGDVPFDLRDQPFILVPSLASSSHLVSRIVEAIQPSVEADGPAVRTVRVQTQSTTKRVFISYSHADAPFLDRILVHLKPLERHGLIDLWSDTKLIAGDRWREEIKNAIDDAAIAVLLISADFLASEFIISDELPPLLAAAERRGVRILPVVVKPSRFLRDESLAKFQALNDPRQPVIAMADADRETLYAKLSEIVESSVVTQRA